MSETSVAKTIAKEGYTQDQIAAIFAYLQAKQVPCWYNSTHITVIVTYAQTQDFLQLLALLTGEIA